ncbi:MAG: hypothetical protein JJ891_05245 [Rhizobiaceae bacterium]|jgi:hypothetical protein|nr:hypothetical protein [Rhizobiaceae bacterium]
MKKQVFSLGTVVAALILSGCNSGITYGTGKSHEEQTVEGLTNMFALDSDKTKKIDYSARPELVMPSDKQSLPAPVDGSADAQPDWPVSPEQRIASVREDAPEPDEYGNLPAEYLADTNKPGIRNSSDVVRRANRPPSAKVGDQFIDEIRNDANGEGTGVEARRRREQLQYSTGVQRKYLTEPPELYRTPSANAEAGETGITQEQVDENVKKERLEKRAIDKGYIIPGS